MAKSFYDIDYLIELNEKRLEEFNGHYNKVLDKYSVPLIIYSAIAIFLVQVIQHEIGRDFKAWTYHVSFGLFIGSFVTSLCYFIRLLVPIYRAFPKAPKEYYITYRQQYERQRAMPADQYKVDNLLKASYISELETTLDNAQENFVRKSHFYFAALIWGLLSSVPYLVCLGFHFSKRDDKVYKVEIVKSKAYFYKANDTLCHTKRKTLSPQ